MKYKVGDLVRVLHTDFPTYIPVGSVARVVEAGPGPYHVLLGDKRLCFGFEEIVPLGKTQGEGNEKRLTITKENLEKAYKEGCSDVKKVLNNLFPGQTKAKDEWVDVTADMEWRFSPGVRGFYLLRGYYGGAEVAFVTNDPYEPNKGVQLCTPLPGAELYRYECFGDAHKFFKKVGA